MKVIAVLPAYNAAHTLEATVRDIPAGAVDEIILVDDASRDDTVAVAGALGLTVIRHEVNRGYGGNQKTCYRAALERGADIVVMIHPDYQYDSRLTPHMISFLKDGYHDVMLGSRIRTRAEALAGGMPPYKYIANRGLTFLQNILTGMNLSEWHTGFRAYTRRVLETVPWEENSDDFVFDSQMMVQFVAFRFRIGEIPVPVRYHDTASSINLSRSITYGIRTLGTVMKLALFRLRLSDPAMFRSRVGAPLRRPVRPCDGS
ncbi:MAG TPA: glycosyltransferase family 2 protein [Bacteroidota bacterium]|nr:glycosyltransferase family 2 protein [Bacteroidota bacterium]